jgi:hypothetical protein
MYNLWFLYDNDDDDEDDFLLSSLLILLIAHVIKICRGNKIIKVYCKLKSANCTFKYDKTHFSVNFRYVSTSSPPVST